eukprot:2722993-Karenia_brevis.AAC.1
MEKDGLEDEDDAMMMENGMEGSKRAGKTPPSQRQAKKGRERAPAQLGVTSSESIAMTPAAQQHIKDGLRVDDNDEDSDNIDPSQPLTAGLLQRLLAQQTKTMKTQVEDTMANFRLQTWTQIEEVRGVAESAQDMAEKAASSASAAMEAVRALQADLKTSKAS